MLGISTCELKTEPSVILAYNIFNQSISRQNGGSMKHTPEKMKDAGSKFWTSFLKEFEPESATEYALLETVCALKDQISDSQEAISRDGDYVLSGGKMIPHPALRHLHQFTGLFLKGLKELRQKEKSGPKPKMLKNTRKGGNVQ